MKYLDPDFSLVKFGFEARLVNEEDADFIVKLRNLPKAANYLHQTEDNVDTQKAWIRSYKERESNGEEYYLIFSQNGQKLGVFRIYNIKDKVFTAGSWIFIDDAPIEAPVAGVVIGLDIAFEQLEMEWEDIFDGVHIDNKKVIKFNKMVGVDFYEERKTPNGVFLLGKLTKESYLKNRPKLLKLIGR